LGCVAEHITAPGDCEIHKTGGFDRSFKLCFQQSTGNSTGPEVDLGFGILWHRCLHQNIANLQPASRFEHASHLAQRCGLSGTRLRTPLEITTSAQPSAAGSASA